MLLGMGFESSQPGSTSSLFVLLHACGCEYAGPASCSGNLLPCLLTITDSPPGTTSQNKLFSISRFQSCSFVTATEMQPVPFPEGFQKMRPSASGHYLKQDKEAQRCCSGGWGTQRPESGAVPFVTFPVYWDTPISSQTLKKTGIQKQGHIEKKERKMCPLGSGVGWSRLSSQTQINNDLILEILSASKINRLMTVGKLYGNASKHCFQSDP